MNVCPSYLINTYKINGNIDCAPVGNKKAGKHSSKICHQREEARSKDDHTSPACQARYTEVKQKTNYLC